MGCEGQVGWPNRAKRGPKHLLMFEKSASERGYGPPWGAWGPSWACGAVLGHLNARGGRRGPADLGALGALLAPSWPSKSILDGQKIGSNLDQNFEALQDRCWKPLRRILGGKMEACWHLKSMKNRCHLREAIFYQSVVFPKRESKF